MKHSKNRKKNGCPDVTFCLPRVVGYNRATLKTLSKLDFEKINNDLIELLIEWIMEGKHKVGGEWIIGTTWGGSLRQPG